MGKMIDFGLSELSKHCVMKQYSRHAVEEGEVDGQKDYDAVGLAKTTKTQFLSVGF